MSETETVLAQIQGYLSTWNSAYRVSIPRKTLEAWVKKLGGSNG
jgi:hypothetical protein